MRKGAWIGTAIGVLLAAAGFLFFFYPNLKEAELRIQTQGIVREWEERQESGGESGAEGEDPEEEESDKDWGEFYRALEDYNRSLLSDGQPLKDAWDYEQTPMELQGLVDGAFGVIEIPDMEVTLPLWLGATADHLADGAAVLYGTSLPIGGEDTNCVIAGHRGYRGMAFFRDIEKLKPGSLVRIVNPWETLTYRAVSFRVIDPDEVEEIRIAPGKDQLTLLTCHPYMGHGKYRYVVFCERADGEGEAAQSVPGSGQEEGEEEPADEEASLSENRIRLERELRVLMLLLLLFLALCLICHETGTGKRKKSGKKEKTE